MQLKRIVEFIKPKRKVFWILPGLLIVALFLAYYFLIHRASRNEYVTAKISRGDIVNKVAETGTLQAVTTVQVGSQASGTVSAIYVDFNSTVHKGQVIAELDPASLQAQVQQAEANLAQSQAAFQVAQANLKNSQA